MIRVGIGYDAHGFAQPGPLVLGGVAIPSHRHLEGHSDGDAVAHALTDAILGAAGAGDIGEMFPDTDATNAGRDSLDMLRGAVARIRASGWWVQQVDIVVVTEEPRIGPHREAMQRALASPLELHPAQVSIKENSHNAMRPPAPAEGP